MIERHPAKRIALYNHKGGVGKTILTVNIAAKMAELGHKVLLVDSDPQANLTSYLIEESVLDSLLDESDTESGRTLWSSLKPIAEASGDVVPGVPYETATNGLFLLPGDIQLAVFEQALTGFWADCFQRLVKGYRGTTALSVVVNQCANDTDADFVFYDTGPNIGPLNRAILLDCDFFIVPAACDLFSRRGLKTLGHTLTRWIKEWETIVALAPDGTYLMDGKPRFMGMIPQRFRIYGGQPAGDAPSLIAQLEKSVFSEIITPLRAIDSTLVRTRQAVKLGEVKDFTTLVQLAQSQGVPIASVKSGSVAQKEMADRAFTTIAKKVINRAQAE